MCTFPALISAGVLPDLPLCLSFQPIRGYERPDMSPELSQIIEYGHDV